MSSMQAMTAAAIFLFFAGRKQYRTARIRITHKTMTMSSLARIQSLMTARMGIRIRLGDLTKSTVL